MEIKEKIKEMIKTVCKEEGWEWRESDQAFSYPITPDPGDCVIEKRWRDELLSSSGNSVLPKEPREKLLDIMYSHWDDYAGNMIGEVIDIIQERLQEDIEEDLSLSLYDQIYEQAGEIMFPEYPFEEYLKEQYLVNLIVDTGDANTDFSDNNFAPHYASGGELRIEKESSLLWLVKQQGRKKRDLLHVIKKDGRTEDPFLESVYQEVANASSCMNALTFLVKMRMEDILSMQEALNRRDKDGFTSDAKKRPDVGIIVIPKSCRCGLVDYWNGAGSVLDIALEKDVILPIKYLRSAEPDAWENYSIHSIYGMCDSAWKVEVKIQVKEEE